MGMSAESYSSGGNANSADADILFIADSLFREGRDVEVCLSLLKSALPESSDKRKSSEVLWRMSRCCLLLGEKETSKNLKRSRFGDGISYAEQAIKADKSNHNAYMWRSANVGRNCQLDNIMTQASKVPLMLADFSMILDTLKRTDCSEAWQGLSEIYFHHPFKSDDSAANFARKALMTIPEGELRLSTYLFFATLLEKRGKDASQRSSDISRNAKKQNQISETEKCAVLDGALGVEFVPKWATKALGKMSDSEEALMAVEYALKLYASKSHHTVIDNEDYTHLIEFKRKYSGN
ncbi:MAG: hypothetical protein KBS57_06565 [Alistipes sp.]|nr:hypothetical protein [Candidatus Minthomonas equi]